MECVSLGDVTDCDVSDTFDCVSLKDSDLNFFDRNLEFFESLNLRGLCSFLSSLYNFVRLNFLSSRRPTRFEYKSGARKLLKSLKRLFPKQQRTVTFDLKSQNTTNSEDKLDLLFDFFVNDKYLTVVSSFHGCNLKVTTIQLHSNFNVNSNYISDELGYKVNKLGTNSSVLITSLTDCKITSLCVNDLLALGFEIFVSFSNKYVAFFRVNTFDYNKSPEFSLSSAVNVTGFLQLKRPAVFSKYSPNREMVLVATDTQVYLLEKSGFDVEYEKLAEFKPGSLLCTDFLNDFEILVLENNFILTVYKKYNLKYHRFIKYNIKSLVTGSAVNTVSPGLGRFARDYMGNLYLLVKNMNLVKFTWSESILPHSNQLYLQPPNDLFHIDKSFSTLVYNFCVENNLVVVTFENSECVHLYGLTSLKELYHLKPPVQGYLPRLVSTSSSNNYCFIVVLWAHSSNFTTALGNDLNPLIQRNVLHRDLIKAYRVKSGLTKDPVTDEPPLSYHSTRPDFTNISTVPNKMNKLPILSSLHPKISFNTRRNDYKKYEDVFGYRRNFLGRSLSDHSLRQPHETVYSLEEFIRNRHKPNFY
ncbi:uncharacterized protein TA14080 [Theileria annulata]|uniref:Uncharacterized protein n=1 Tax=Theileria annulata TaxID=5874 RepID=Q4UEV5_THEAN|nr:uncharacterized protein TA14080 [Theileria annulata]CAI74384.1 hypothetical protein TA14080 [Theileria annulata]|eukprot:XP_952116.1 hypothetical protein TA14080 [Theileria annulata]